MAWSKVGASAGVKLGGLLSAGASAVGLLALFGCGSLGNRAMSGCPEGEVCSSGTPDGLRFYGAGLSGTLSNGVGAVAVGGTQSVRWEDAGSSIRALPDHVATSSAPTVIELTATRAGGATLTARASGSATLRVTEPTGPLLDSIGVSAARLERVRLGRPLLTNPTREIVYLAGMRDVFVELLSAEDGRLVDESATIEADVTTPPSRRTWDGLSVELPAAGTTLIVSSVGRTFEVELPVVSAVDDIGINPHSLGEGTIESEDPLRVYEGGLLCFEPRAGERTVVGVEGMFGYIVDGEAGEGDAALPCIAVPSADAGTIQIEITLAGLTRTFTAEVLPTDTTMSLVGELPIVMPLPTASLGARAALSRGLALPHTSGRPGGI